MPHRRRQADTDTSVDAHTTSWRDDALCAQTDPETFFPEKGKSTGQAKRLCAACTVTAQCLDQALVADERFGVWGGLSERERRALKRRKRSTEM